MVWPKRSLTFLKLSMSASTRDSGVPLLPRVGQLACQAVVEAAAVAQGGERVAHADFLRFGQMRAQVVDLRLRLLEALLQLAGLVLHLGVLGEEELDDDTDLVRARRSGQVLSRLRERDGIALAGIQDSVRTSCRTAAAWLSSCSAVVASLAVDAALAMAGRDLARWSPPSEDAEPDQAEHDQADQARLGRYETRDQQRDTRPRHRPPAAMPPPLRDAPAVASRGLAPDSWR